VLRNGCLKWLGFEGCAARAGSKAKQAQANPQQLLDSYRFEFFFKNQMPRFVKFSLPGFLCLCFFKKNNTVTGSFPKRRAKVGKFGENGWPLYNFCTKTK
jgi:hypothetical protein